MHHLHGQHFPFTGIVGQERLKLALLLNAVNPRIGGVLIRGEKGTAKSTAARSLAELLPEIEVVTGCPFQCHPRDVRLMCDECVRRVEQGETLPSHRRRVSFVTLPLGATEDRVVGSIDVQAALSTGRAQLKPGLLAEAHRGILYVDEVNLLDDHLVDVLLDAAAMGRNIVEREGISVVHPARFLLVGTMNPEEGELRPQLLDRFGLAVDVEGIRNVEERVEILDRLDAFDRDPHALAHRFAGAQEGTRARIVMAQERWERITVERPLMAEAARRAMEAGVDGHRADVALVKVAVTLAAWEGESVASSSHVAAAAELVLPHRQRRRTLERVPPQAPQDRERSDRSPSHGGEGTGAADAEEPATNQPPPLVPTLPEPRARGTRAGKGASGSGAGRGKKLDAIPAHGQEEPVDVAATLMAAAMREGPPERGEKVSRGLLAENRPVPEVQVEDLRVARISPSVRRAVCFLVDTSRSMGARQRIRMARSTIRHLLGEGYRERVEVSLVVMGGDRSREAIGWTRDVNAVDAALSSIRAAGRTPLADGLRLAAERLERASARGLAPCLVLITDGRANVPLSRGGDPLADALAAAERFGGVDALVVDTENDFLSLGIGGELARALSADHVRCSPDDGDDPILPWLGRHA